MTEGAPMGIANREPKNIASRNTIEYKAPVGVFLSCFYYILGVPCLESLFELFQLTFFLVI